MLLKSTQGNITLVDISGDDTPESGDVRTALSRFEPAGQATVLRRSLAPELFGGYNFMLISYHTWNDVSEHHKKALQRMPSTLILNRELPSEKIK
jgi:hypothetical protein